MHNRQVRRSRVGAIVIAAGVIGGVLPVSGASAGGSSADVAVFVLSPDPSQQPTGDVDYLVEVDNNGPDAASSVNVAFVSTGGSITSVTDISTHVASTFTCTVDTTTHAHCTIASLSLNQSFRNLDVVVNSASGGHDQSVTGTVTASTNDPDTSNNSSEGDAFIVVPPAATMVATAAEDKFSNSVTVTGTLTATSGGAAIPGQALTLWLKAPGASAFTKVDGTVATDGSGQGSFSVSQTDPFGAGSFVFEVRHGKSAGADTAKGDVTFAPPATTLTISPPKSAAYRAPTIVPGVLQFVSGGAPVNGSSVLLQARPKGSSGSWSTVASTFVRNKQGSLRFKAKLDHSSDLRAAYVSTSPGSATSVSDTKTIDVAAGLTATASPRFVPPGSPATVSAAVAPAVKGGRLLLQQAVKSGWKTIAHGSTNKHGHKTWTVNVGHHLGTASYRVVRSKTAHNLSATSKPAKLTVEKHAGGAASDHAFLFFKGSNVHDVYRWNPCQAIHYRINPHEAPAHGVADAKEAVRRVAQASGLHFIYDGAAHSIPQGHGKQAAPLVIAWATQSQTDLSVDKTEDGAGGGSVLQTSPPKVVRGWAVLLAHEKGIRPGFGRGQTTGALLLHEIGHAVGLDHSTGAAQIMYGISQSARPAAIFGAGDFRGLQILGDHSHGCTTEIHAN